MLNAKPNIISTLVSLFFLSAVFIFSTATLSSVSAKEMASAVKTIKLADLKNTIKTDSQNKKLVLLISSLDKNCSPCILSNKHFKQSAEQLKQYNFSTLLFQPYTNLPDSFVKEYNLFAMPTHLVFYQGKLVSTFYGNIKSNDLKEHLLKNQQKNKR